MKTTRLSLIEDHEARFAQGVRNSRLASGKQPIEGEEDWSREDYEMQMTVEEVLADLGRRVRFSLAKQKGKLT